ncbi:fungal-specific transcription factor domain-containing protein [Leptodontidium sp. MPI-SDFR-AT-0119]|nr:fungal-specific transcription factor domain-containing protein [Leptodontidium sp. MPI-SDFR-AT-0119]
MQQESQEIPREPQPKRRKIQLACNKCRNRKTRCDGHRPTCVACLDRGLAAECTYEVNAPPPKRSASQHVYQEPIAHSITPKPADKNAGYLTDGSPMSSGHHLASIRSGGSVAAELMTRPAKSSDNNRVDGLATVAFPHQDANLYGESSTIAFVRHVMHEPPRQENWQDTAASPELEAIRDRDESLMIYPRRQAADNYMNSFWEFVHPVFPILHKTFFMSKYAEVWSPQPDKSPNSTNQVDEAAFSSCLNLTFALGCQFRGSIAADKRVAVADEFYQRARKIFIYDVLDTSSMPVLQMLLLTSVYLQSTRYSERCWNSVGLAIRAAQTLGLHSESIARRPATQVTREIRRRVWHVCVTLDRLLAMTFGRPAMITRSWGTPLPLMIDDEFLQAEGEGHQPIDIPSRLGLFVFSSKLYEILDKILVTFYTPEPPTLVSTDDSMQKLLGNMLTFNRQLDVFRKSIPDYLRLPAKDESPGPHMHTLYVQIQARILHCRFLYTRVILLRPLLLLSTQSNLRNGSDASDLWGAVTLDRELASHACNLCVKTTQELVENLCQNLDTPYRISPWHTVYLSFAAAIVLIAAQRCPAIDPAAKEEAIDHSLGQCITILAYYEAQIHSAGQAIRVLQKLRGHLRKTQSRINSGHATNRGSPLHPSSMPDGHSGMDLENFANMEPSQDWWNEILQNRTEFGSETWYNQHLVNLDWLDIS